MLKLTKRFITNIVNGKWQIYEETNDEIFVYYTHTAFTYSYGEYYFYNDDKSFKLSDYNKKWRVNKK